jgi:hypothetical protein
MFKILKSNMLQIYCTLYSIYITELIAHYGMQLLGVGIIES